MVDGSETVKPTLDVSKICVEPTSPPGWGSLPPRAFRHLSQVEPPAPRICGRPCLGVASSCPAIRIGRDCAWEFFGHDQAVRNRFGPPRIAARAALWGGGAEWRERLGGKRAQGRWGATGVSHITMAVGGAGYAGVRCLVRGRGSCVGEEILLAGGLQAGDRPVVGWGTRGGQSRRRRTQALVAQEALDGFRVADERTQLHVAPAGRAPVHGQTNGQAQ